MSNNRRARVLFKGEVAGSLEETAGGGTRFTYNAGWSQPIGCALPVDRREHEWGEGLHPFFQHMAPEGWPEDGFIHRYCEIVRRACLRILGE